MARTLNKNAGDRARGATVATKPGSDKERCMGAGREFSQAFAFSGPHFQALRDNVRSQLRVLVKRILRKHGYPPDKQERATETVLAQAALLSEEWAAA